MKLSALVREGMAKHPHIKPKTGNYFIDASGRIVLPHEARPENLKCACILGFAYLASEFLGKNMGLFEEHVDSISGNESLTMRAMMEFDKSGDIEGTLRAMEARGE